MTIRTFWTIFIKILGIWLVLNSMTVLPQFLSTLFLTDPNDTLLGSALVASALLLTIGLYIFTFRFFIFRTSWVIDKLHLEKGFEEERIDLKVQLSTVLTVATIVVGGLIFVDSLPELCRQIFLFFQQKNMFRESPTSGYIIFQLVKTLLGYLLMTNSKQVVIFIGKQTEKLNDKLE